VRGSPADHDAADRDAALLALLTGATNQKVGATQNVEHFYPQQLRRSDLPIDPLYTRLHLLRFGQCEQKLNHG